MRCLVASSIGLALLVAVGGCRNCAKVERELRGREGEVRELKDELDRCAIYNQTMEAELRSLRGELGLPPAGGPVGAYPVQTLALGRQTGGRSNDSCPGDDSLQVQIEPRDPDNQAIKAPGTALIQVQEVTKEGLKRPLSQWEIPPDQMRRSWKNGLLTTGYVLNLPWKVWPTTEKLHVSALFQLPDGRTFGADKDVTVRLTPANRRPTTPAPCTTTPTTPTPTPSDDGGPSLLPPPRVEPGKPGTKKGEFVPPTPSPVPPADLARPMALPPSLWQQVDPPPPAPPAEILRPIPLKSVDGVPGI